MGGTLNSHNNNNNNNHNAQEEEIDAVSLNNTSCSSSSSRLRSSGNYCAGNKSTALEEAQYPLLQRKKFDNNNNVTISKRLLTDSGGAGSTAAGSAAAAAAGSAAAGSAAACASGSNVFIGCLASAFIWSVIPLCFLGGFCLEIITYIILFPLFLAKPTIRVKLLGQIFRGTQVLFTVYLNPFWRVKTIRLPKDPNYVPDGKTLVMCNHLSAADPWIFSAVFYPWEMKWICKGDLFKIPIAGQAIAMAGDLMVKFTNVKGGWGTQPGSVKQLMDDVDYLGNQHNIGVVIFPEGTRSRSGRLQPFKNGFFRFAIEHHREILPCVEHHGNLLWPVGQYFVGYGTAYVSIGDPIKPQPDDTIESLKEKVRNKMIELLREMPEWNEEVNGPLDPDVVISTRGTGLIAGK